jgi:hypothetical protein
VKFRKKPVVIEAVQWTGENVDEFLDFVGPMPDVPHVPTVEFANYEDSPDEAEICTASEAKQLIATGTGSTLVVIDTLEGKMTAFPGAWIIRGVQGELYPCQPDIFEQTYDAA